MRELTLEELELVAGGEDTGDIVVTGDTGGGGDGFWDYFGDYGDTGGGDGGGGGGGDAGTTPPPIVVTSDDHGNSVTVQPKYDPTAHTADIIVTAKNSAGDFKIDFDLAKLDVKSLTLDIQEGSSTYTGTIDLSSGLATGTYSVQFSNGASGSFSVGTNGSDVSVGAALQVHF